MKFVVISDTHGKHQELNIPFGDVLIHAGDISSKGEHDEVIDFLNWFESQEHRYKIFIAGNHDFYFERETASAIASLVPQGIIYLHDSGITIEGISIWGSPITPWFFNWAFNRHRGASIRQHWDAIPDKTDIIITHGPAYRILDRTVNKVHVGCKDFLRCVLEKNPKVHICGHIHEAYGMVEKFGIQFINASVLNEHYEVKNNPITFELTK